MVLPEEQFCGKQQFILSCLPKGNVRKYKRCLKNFGEREKIVVYLAGTKKIIVLL